MAPKTSEFDAICLLIDVGPSSSRSGYLEEAKNAAMSLLERKMFSEAKDRFGLVLFGSKETENPLNYKGVKIVKDVWGPASFDLLRYLEIKVGGDSDEGSDWLDAIVVGLDFLKDKAPTANKKIVLMSDLASPCNEDQFEVIVTNMESENVELCFFGPEVDDDSSKDQSEPSTSNRNGNDGGGHPPSNSRPKPQSSVQIAASNLINQMVERTDGIFCNVEEAMLNLLYKERKSKKPFPWRVALEIGPNIRISTTGYIAVRREPVKSWKKCLARPSDESSYELRPEVSYVSKENSDKKVDSDNLIESYKYGSKLITVSDEDKANFHYDGGGKSLKVIGFIKQDQIPHQYLLGNGNMVFLPTENDPHSSTALSTIILSMIELRRAALVRKVYRAKTTPRLGILVPESVPPEDDESTEESLRLIFIELPYAEDVRKFTFLPMYSELSRPSDEQLEAMDKYIEAAGLDDDDVQTESLANPCHQYLYRCLTHRALNPGRVLPNVDGFIKKLFNTPDKVVQDTKEILESMITLFPLEELKESTKGRKRKTDETESNEEIKHSKHDVPVTTISDTSPASDFNKLLEQGTSFERATQMLESVITQFIRKGPYDKTISCLKAYREACLIKSQPIKYNDFLREFKRTMQGEEDVMDIWLEIAEKSLGLITKFEHGKSGVLTREADDFLTSI